MFMIPAIFKTIRLSSCPLRCVRNVTNYTGRLNMSNSDESKDKIITPEVVSICKQTQSLLDLTGGWIKPTGTSAPRFRTLWKQSDASISESQVYLYKDFTAKGEALVCAPTSKPGLIKQGPWNEGEGGFFAHMHSYADSKFCLDLWSDEHGMKRRYDLTDDKHGPPYLDSEFSSLSFSENGEYLVYVAEKKVPKGVSFYKENVKESDVRGAVYDYSESWGEQLDKCSSSVLCVLHLESGSVKILSTPDGVFCGKPAWSGNNFIYFIGFDLNCMKNGAIYCWNRNSRLYSYDLSCDAAVAHTPLGNCVYMPSPAPSGDVAFLMCEAGGPHRKYMDVCVFSPNGNGSAIEESTLKVVPGSLFFGALSPSPWIDNDHLLLSSCEGVTNQVYKINIHDGSKHSIFASGEPSSFQELGTMSFEVIDQIGSQVLLSYSHLNPLSDLYKQGLCYLDLINPHLIIYLISPQLSKKKCNYTVEHFARDGREYNGILVKPGDGIADLKTLIVWPHGGPHSVFTTQFKVEAYTFSRLGYSTLMVNYTGSLGLGADSIQSLIGNVGDVDVKDVQYAAEQVASEFKHVVVMGGSHGGFLTAHLIGQFPHFYKAAVMRNPVIDMSSMVGSSDIPDWCFVESGLEYDSYSPPVPDTQAVATMLDKSPIKYLNQVTCPSLLLIGAKDLRVPPSQGIRYYKMLKSRGVECELKLYPDDCHPLSSVACFADCWLQIHLWFKQNLQLNE